MNLTAGRQEDGKCFMEISDGREMRWRLVFSEIEDISVEMVDDRTSLSSHNYMVPSLRPRVSFVLGDPIDVTQSHDNPSSHPSTLE